MLCIDGAWHLFFIFFQKKRVFHFTFLLLPGLINKPLIQMSSNYNGRIRSLISKTKEHGNNSIFEKVHRCSHRIISL